MMKGLKFKMFDEYHSHQATKNAQEFCRNVEVFQVSHNMYVIGSKTYTSILITYK